MTLVEVTQVVCNVVVFGSLSLLFTVAAVGGAGKLITALIDWIDNRKRRTPDLIDADLLESVDSKTAELLAVLADRPLTERVEWLEKSVALLQENDLIIDNDVLDLDERLEAATSELDDLVNAHNYLEDSVIAVEDRVKVLEGGTIEPNPLICEDCDDAGFGDCLHPDFCSMKSEPARVHRLEDWLRGKHPAEGFCCGTATDPADLPKAETEWEAYSQSDPLADKGEVKTEEDNEFTPNQKDSEQESV